MWHKIRIDLTQIEYETGRATLIKLPNSSRLKGWQFWHPSKLVRESEKGNGHWFEFSFNDEWEFKLIRQSRNNDATTTIGADEMLDAFDKQSPRSDSETYLKVSEPEKINANVEVDESLKS
ncbi:hypothetical protein EH553_01145 [Staphylococcus pseudintermedius]|uniref:hypothetical protein n=1 Tax=Staphylococcus pseudintermedius TaxID=283734 RepID=UPI0018E17EEC|nr:hypothetical protein [Staphylococcus pseudintermedius]EGQ0325065.1 hypothetical protein [Staphylococcus pseudintermedius]EGQ4357219.1 hypothetical protein [Staphylococcus pseudintermedius]EKH7772736.1 hypothetical protein [Staphylococcus pseudintermedius]QQA52123.1 hypothetical protein JC281_06290 [Staphylococcus pseudintermedius]